jgi:hypothetical protein
MTRFLTLLAMIAVVTLSLAACNTSGRSIAEFWRPISEPNIMLPLEKAQVKLEYDLSQCSCGIFPRNVPQGVMAEFQPDQQRMIETSATGVEEGGQCLTAPSLVVAECMRSRGWEVTKCSGRMPVAGGGAVCAAYAM